MKALKTLNLVETQSKRVQSILHAINLHTSTIHLPKVDIGVVFMLAVHVVVTELVALGTVFFELVTDLGTVFTELVTDVFAEPDTHLGTVFAELVTDLGTVFDVERAVLAKLVGDIDLTFAPLADLVFTEREEAAFGLSVSGSSKSVM